MDKFLKNLLWVLGILMIVNLLVLDFVWFKPKVTTPQETQTFLASTPIPGAEIGVVCGTDCLKEIQQEVQKAVANLPTVKPTAEKIAQPIPTSPSTKIVYISIGSTGSTANTSWADIPGTDFYFDLSDYPGVKSVRWEASLQSYLSSDPVYVRLYDVTNNRAVDGSDLTTTFSTYQYIRSSDLTIWRGNNLYRIQARGSSGNTVNLSSPRLKIILE